MNCVKERRTCSLFVLAAAAQALLWAPMAPAQTRTIIKSFDGSDGAMPFAGLILSGGRLYGTTESGSSSNDGTVFAVNTDGTGYTVLKNFTGTDGKWPYASLVLAGTTLYGTTEFGGSSGYGTVFTVNTDGTGYNMLKNFTDSDGAENAAGLVLSGDTLYGATFSTDCDAPPNNGRVFKIKTNGTGYTVLKHFNGSDGSRHASLTLSGGTLYGVTDWGGSSGNGTVFKMKTDGTGYTVLRSFSGGSDGSYPWGALVLSGSTLYGTTENGGTAGRGTLFKVNTDGTGYRVLKSFTCTDSFAGPQGGLVLSGSTLYGTTYCGGTASQGTVFQVSTDGTGYSVLKSFTGSDGARPAAGLVMCGSALYGTTIFGGEFNNGMVFRIDLPPIVLTADDSSSFTSNGFGFTLSGTAGQTVVIEASTNLTFWTPLLTSSLPAGSFHFNDPDSTNFVQRFYRAGLTP
jgi:uncharacterized repeat protein (TIGR03803 family)